MKTNKKLFIILAFLTFISNFSLQENDYSKIDQLVSAIVQDLSKINTETDQLSQNIFSAVSFLQTLSVEFYSQLDALESNGCDCCQTQTAQFQPVVMQELAAPSWVKLAANSSPGVAVYQDNTGYYMPASPNGTDEYVPIAKGYSNFWYSFNNISNQYELWSYNQFGIPTMMSGSTANQTAINSNAGCNALDYNL
jgi:hypothetical protein